MNTIGSTPISVDDATDLIPDIATQKELNEWELQNIVSAQEWIFNPRVLARIDPLDESYLRLLHKKMFGETWKWAGVYRKRNGLNIGCPFHEIRDRIGGLLGDVRHQVEHKVFDIDEIAVRLHHRLVWQIHAFPNGNGRHARMLADVLVVKDERTRFSWGPVAGKLDGDVRKSYFAALNALDADEKNAKPLLDFARS